MFGHNFIVTKQGNYFILVGMPHNSKKLSYREGTIVFLRNARESILFKKSPDFFGIVFVMLLTVNMKSHPYSICTAFVGFANIFLYPVRHQKGAPPSLAYGAMVQNTACIHQYRPFLHCLSGKWERVRRLHHAAHIEVNYLYIDSLKKLVIANTSNYTSM